MRIPWKLLASALSCTVLIAAYQNETTSARASSSSVKDADLLGAADTANVADGQSLPPGDFRFTTGVDRQPQYVHGPVTCDTRADTHRIMIGDSDAGGLEVGLTLDESSLKYVDLGNRGGVYFALFNDALTEGGEPSAADGAVKKVGDTYFVSGRATGTSATQHLSTLQFDISVACP